MSAAPPPLANPTDTAHYLPNIAINAKSLYYVKSSEPAPLTTLSRPTAPLPSRRADPGPSIDPRARSLAASASIAGATAGILGLTNSAGFIFYLFSALAVGALFPVLRGGGKGPGTYWPAGWREPLTAGVVEHAAPFVLFWTREWHCASWGCSEGSDG